MSDRKQTPCINSLFKLPPFSGLPAAAVEPHARHINLLKVPQGRWLITRSGQLHGHLYLLRGRLLLRHGRRKSLQRNPGSFYPGCEAAQALTSAHIAHVPAAQHTALCTAAASSAAAGFSTSGLSTPGLSTPGHVDPEKPHANTTAPFVQANEVWLQRFLHSNMMQKLSQVDWQRLLSALRSQTYSAGEAVIKQGDAARCCYILANGHAVVHRGQQTLCHLAPGDLFGEDALISGLQRNAGVSALDNVTVLALPDHLFVDLVLAKNIHFIEPQSAPMRQTETVWVTLDKTPHSDLRIGENRITVSLTELRQHITRLPVTPTYYVAGGTIRQRTLAAFLMTQKGLRAHPLNDSSV